MAIPKPTFTSTGPTVSIDVPPSWNVVISALTHKPYNQLVACDWDDHDHTIMTSLFANKWLTPDVLMHDITNNNAPELVLLPQIVPLQLKVQSYFSKSQSTSGKFLREEKYSSNQVRVVTAEGAHDENVPEHFTVLITVQDEVPHDWQPAYDSSIITVRCSYNQKATSQYNLGNIQGDILPGLPKTVEYFYYFAVYGNDFGKIFKQFLLPKITSALKLVSQPTAYDFVGVNVGFSRWFLGDLVELPEVLQDEAFYTGQSADSQFLGDAGAIKYNRWWPSSWDDEFKSDEFDGIFIITAYDGAIADIFVYELERAFSTTIFRKLLLKGRRRPGEEEQNDHFGYRGGISNPEVRGVTFDTQMQSDPRYPGSPIIPMGAVIMGYDGDGDKDTRPEWAKDGTFMVTRKLDVFVPEFEAFLRERGPKYFPHLPVDDAADKLGARFFGRWKDGTPIELSPDSSDASIMTDDERINNFIFQSKGQTHCPYAAHIRKSSPRNYVSPDESDNSHFIRRAGISYGPEVTDEERYSQSTFKIRGSHFVCYSSSIVRGFKHIQSGRSNDTVFPPRKVTAPGMDPIIGQTNSKGQSRYMTGADPDDERRMIIFPSPFTIPRGGDYFFVPSISTLRDYVVPRTMSRRHDMTKYST